MIQAETRDFLCAPELLTARDAHFDRLRALFRGEILDRPFFLNGIGGRSDADPYAQPEQWAAEALDSLLQHAAAAADPAVFRPLAVEFGPYGVHYIDKMLGARVYRHKGNWWSECLDTPVGELQPPGLDADGTWRLSRRLAHAFLAAGVTVPLFGLPTIASALNVVLNVRGPDFLVALHTRPDAARHDLQVINGLLCTLHRWYLDHLPPGQLQPVVAVERTQPPGHGQLCGCSCHLLSAEHYRDFIAPLDDALLSVYPHGGMIHLCGVHTQHIPVWRQMASLRAVQLNDRAAEDYEIYFRQLRDDQVIYLNPTATMTVARALAISGGRRTVLVAPDGLRP